MMNTADQPAVPDIVARMTSLLHRQGARMTAGRELVLTVVARHQGHLSAEDILTEAKKAEFSVHRASIYRTLTTLVELGVLQRVAITQGPTRYQFAQAVGNDPATHARIGCPNCGATQRLSPLVLESLSACLSVHTGFALDPEVALTGTCTACTAR